MSCMNIQTHVFRFNVRPLHARMALLLAVLLCVGSGPATPAMAQQPLTLQQAIGLALGQSPQAALAQADEAQARAGVALARSALLPQLQFDEDISRGNDPVYAFGTRLRQGRFTQADFALNALNSPQPIGNFASRLSGSWLAFDSFQTQRTLRAAALARKSAGSATKAANQKIVLDVVQAYEGVLFAQRQLAVAQHEQQSAAALLKQVSDRVHAGLAVDSDLMSAQVNSAARQQDLIAAQGGVQLAWAQLRLAMGAPDLPESTLAPIQPHTFPQDSLSDELATAAKIRPDLRALTQATAAQSAAVGAARSSFGPRLSAYGNWEQDRPTFAGDGGNHWVAGAQLTIDILPIGKRAELDRQKAVQQRVTAQLAAAHQQMQLQVSQAHIQRQTAALSLATAQAALTQSAESLRILRNRYDAGLATITDLLRAEDAERQAQASYWQAVYTNSMAYAQLLFATGTLTPDAAEVLQ